MIRLECPPAPVEAGFEPLPLTLGCRAQFRVPCRADLVLDAHPLSKCAPRCGERLGEPVHVVLHLLGEPRGKDHETRSPAMRLRKSTGRKRLPCNAREAAERCSASR